MIRGISTLLAGLAVLAAAATSAGAVGTIDLSWHACSPVVTAITSPTAGPHRMAISVLGHEAAHQRYVVSVHVYDPAGGLPDAWRFDPTGCQGSAFVELRHAPFPDVAAVCPPFAPAAGSLQIKQYDYDPGNGRAAFVIGNVYPGVATSNSATRYFLAGAVFDHTDSVIGTSTPGVTCGGFERDVVLSLQPPCIGIGCRPSATWTDLQGGDHDFLIGNSTLTFCGSCPVVPVRASTWGQVKGAYRR